MDLLCFFFYFFYNSKIKSSLKVETKKTNFQFSQNRPNNFDWICFKIKKEDPTGTNHHFPQNIVLEVTGKKVLELYYTSTGRSIELFWKV